MAEWRFVETDFHRYEMEVALYIEGADVTPWVTETINWQFSPRGDVNVLSFTLANPEDIWLVRKENVKGKWRLKPGAQYSEDAKKRIYITKMARNAKDPTTLQWVYNLGEDSLIFNKHDCIRFFVRNPLTSTAWWMYGFTGFINKYPMAEDYLNGTSTINIDCYCIKGLMQRMLVALNPISATQLNAIDQRTSSNDITQLLQRNVILGEEARMFETLWSSGGDAGFTHPLVGKNFKKCLQFLMFGDYSVAKESGNSLSTYGTALDANFDVSVYDWQLGQSAVISQPEKDAITWLAELNTDTAVMALGGFKANGTWANKDAKSIFAKYPNEVAKLTKYQELAAKYALQLKAAYDQRVKSGRQQEIEGPVKPSTVNPSFRGHVGRLSQGEIFHYPGDSLETWHSLCLLRNQKGDYLSTAAMRKLGSQTTLDNQPGSPYNGLVHLLLPKEGIPADAFVQVNLTYTHDFGSGVDTASRFDLVEMVCDQLDYQWYVTPGGDVAFEFPMYDFEHSIFGKHAGVFYVNKHATQSNIEDEASDTPTGLVVTATEANANVGEKSVAEQLDPNRRVVYSPIMTARLGAKIDTIEAPVAVGGARTRNGVNALSDPRGLHVLENWALLQLQKEIGKDSTLTFPLAFRPWVLPNRPFYFKIRERKGLASNIGHTLSVGDAATTDITIAYVKKLQPDGKFRHIATGGENLPINYTTQFTGSGDVKNSGHVIIGGVTTGTSLGTEAIKNLSKAWRPPVTNEPLDKKLKELRPEFRSIVAQILSKLQEAGYRPEIYSASRSLKTQQSLQDRGLTVTSSSLRSEPATGGPHHWGLAVDIWDKKLRRQINAEAAEFVKHIGYWANQFGIDWGGLWPRKTDLGRSWETYGIGWDPHHIQYRKKGQVPINLQQEYKTSC